MRLKYQRPLNRQPTIDDLDQDLVKDYLDRLRRSRPRLASFEGFLHEIMKRVRVLVIDNGLIRPTIAELLTFGKYPPEFFPRMIITFMQRFGKTECREYGTPVQEYRRPKLVVRYF